MSMRIGGLWIRKDEDDAITWLDVSIGGRVSLN